MKRLSLIPLSTLALSIAMSINYALTPVQALRFAAVAFASGTLFAVAFFIFAAIVTTSRR